jgi:hypothetical protein
MDVEWAVMSISAHPDSVALPPRLRILLMTVRQALIIVLGAIEDYLEMERSIIPRHGLRRRAERDLSA